jgi:cell wall-associated NlpC family hydrolase
MRAVLAGLGAALVLAASAAADTFTVVPGEFVLPSAEVPNSAGDIAYPAEISTPPAQPALLTYEELLALWQQAGTAYGVPWETLAAINEVESNFGRNMGPSYAGAVGWMQFLPSTWEGWGLDADGDGVADPWNPTDAVFSAARYLAASGAAEDLPGAIWSYNHSQEYVDLVLRLSGEFLANPLRGRLLLYVPGAPDTGVAALEQQLADAHAEAADLDAQIAALIGQLDDNYRGLLLAKERTGDPTLGDRAFEAAEQDLAALDGVQGALEAELQQVQDTRGDVDGEIAALEQAIAEAQSPFATNGLEGLFGRPPTPAAAATIEYAVRQLGIPYHWGGNHGFSLDEMIASEPAMPNGFDCSSLVAWSFAKGAGIYIGDWTGTQWEYGLTAPGATRGAGPAQEGGSPPPGGYLPGDLVFFNTTDHVGLYLGNGLFIHAPHTGDVVRVARLADYPLQVWGWVRYAQVSGLVFGSDPDASQRVFSVAEDTAPAAADAADDPAVVTFTR